MRITVVGLVFLLAGCAGDPEADRLHAGDEVMLFAKDATLNSISTFQHPSRGGDKTFVAPGTKARIVSDDEPAEGPKSIARDVRIHILEGQAQGSNVYVGRMWLRPVK